MKKTILILIISLTAFLSKAQFYKNNRQDSIVQLYGVVMTADSLRALPEASVVVLGKGRGTLTNEQGVFSIAVMKGDKIEFSTVGYKPKTITIPADLKDNDYSVIQLLVNDTSYLPATIIRPRPTRAQFEREFVQTDIPFDKYEIARQNTESSKRRILLAALPADGREAVNYVLRQNSNRAYYAGQNPPNNILNPAAWIDFIKAWKRGDFRSKK